MLSRHSYMNYMDLRGLPYKLKALFLNSTFFRKKNIKHASVIVLLYQCYGDDESWKRHLHILQVHMQTNP